jgi:hypothetical protein
MTMDIYSHVLPSMHQEAIERLNAVIEDGDFREETQRAEMPERSPKISQH